MTASTTQPTLREFVQPIVRHKILLLLTIVIAVGASVFLSARQKHVYQATATFGISDQSNEFGVAGILAPSTRTPAQIALAGAQVVRTPTVVNRVKSALHTSATPDELLNDVSASVDPESNLISVAAKGDSAAEAQARANAFTSATIDVSNQQSRQDYAQQAKALRQRRPKKASPDVKAQYNSQIARLVTLSTISAPASLVESARRPQSPISPKPLRNGVVAGLLGLIVGIALVFLRDSLDRRLHKPHEIESELRLPLIGHIRDEALGRAPEGDKNRLIESLDWEQFRIIRRNLEFLDATPPSSVAITSALPEEGKTTVALFVALASAEAGRRTLLIECDLRQPMLAQRVPHLKKSPGVTDFVTGKAKPAEILQTIAIPEHRENGALPTEPHQLVCITAGTQTTHPVEILGSDRFREMLEQVQKAYDLVVLDTPPMLPVVDARELLPRVGAVIVCARAQRLTRDQARSGRAAIEQLPESPRGLVVTGTTRADERAYGYYSYGYTS